MLTFLETSFSHVPTPHISKLCSPIPIPHSATSGAIAYGESQFGPGMGPIGLAGVQCSGQESLLLQCSSLGEDEAVCDHTREAGVFCFSGVGREGGREGGVVNISVCGGVTHNDPLLPQWPLLPQGSPMPPVPETSSAASQVGYSGMERCKKTCHDLIHYPRNHGTPVPLCCHPQSLAPTCSATVPSCSR